jgi:hypothetical protein
LTEETRADLTPRSGDVAHELITLRQRDGMSMRKLRDCPAIKSLPAVREELRRRNLDLSDLHVAAYEALKCGVRSLVARTDYSKILSRTLNIDSDDRGLDDRRALLRAELYISEKAYRRLEDEAYLHFAGVLVIERQAPCDQTGAATPRDFVFDLRVTATAEDIASLLNLISFERRHEIYQRLSNALIEALPNAKLALSEAGYDLAADPWRATRALGNAVFRELWPPRSESESLPVFMAESMSNLLFGGFDPADQHLEIARNEDSRFPQETLYILKTPMDGLYRIKEISLLALALEILRVEEADGWRDLLRRGTAAHSAVRS